MDGMPISPSPVPARPRSRRTFTVFTWVVILTGVISGLMLVLETGMFTPVSFVHLSFAGIPPSRAQDAHLFGPNPSFARVMLPRKEQHWVIDTAMADHVRYYLIFDPKALTSNLFTTDKTGKLTQVTSSPTFKFWLSYDPSSKTFVYDAGTIKDTKEIILRTDWTVTTYSLNSGKERTFGAGFQPSFLTGGTVVARTKSSLVAIPLTEASSTPLVNATLAQPFAVTHDGKTLALYNPTTKAIDVFDVHVIGASSYLRSITTKVAPTAMTYVGSHLLLATHTANSISFNFADLWGMVRIPTPGNVGVLKLNVYE